jgi:hypothetical protein
LVVTAAHVVEQSANKIAFGNQLREESQVEMFGHEALPLIKADAQSGGGYPLREKYKDGLDLAIIALPLRVEIADFR